ncbi:MAG: zinc ABC transporter substrate-binding protein [Deltaproteobacteria bacterium]|nr:zinc ABC transporter substrate-binding protein [Deltaproteobacteria bacterium]
MKLFLFLFAFLTSVASASPYRIVTTTGMIADITREIAKDKANVVCLMQAGVDPHLYKPTRTDIATLSQADIVFYNGLLLEGKMTDALIRVAMAGKKVFAVTERIDKSYLLEPKEFQGHYDPHVWMDPNAWLIAAKFIHQQLVEYDRDNTEQYTENLKIYSEQLLKLSHYAENALNSVPEKSRVLITAHDAFNYFGRRFNFDVRGIQGISTESEAGVKDIEQLVKLIVERNIKAVFIESTVSQKNINALIEGSKAAGHSVKIGGQLFSDAMGIEGTYEGTYIGMIDHNVTTIARALGADLNPKGMQGKLSVEIQK